MCYCYLADHGVISYNPLEMPMEIPEDNNDSEGDMKLVWASRKGKLPSGHCRLSCSVRIPFGNCDV